MVIQSQNALSFVANIKRWENIMPITPLKHVCLNGEYFGINGCPYGKIVATDELATTNL